MSGPRRLGWLLAVTHRAASGAGVLSSLLACVSATSCEPPPPPAVAITVRARSETGAPVANADVFAGPTKVAHTDRDGSATLYITGAEGDTFFVRVDCPQGFRSPNEPLSVRRLGIAAATSVPEYDVICHELRHTMVVAVRAEGGPDLPVLYLGKEVARTDRSGAAHVTIAMDVHERIELMLGTAGKENEKIHPQNPVSVFEMPDHDDIQVFPVTFTRDVKKAPPRAGGRRINVF
jgi:hypothetical protein